MPQEKAHKKEESHRRPVYLETQEIIEDYCNNVIADKVEKRRLYIHRELEINTQAQTTFCSIR